jgi:protease-4
VSMRNLIVRLFSGLWAGADGLRKVLHLVLLVFIFALFFGALSDTPPIFPKKAALYIQPNGALVEQLEGDPYDRALAELFDDGQQQMLVQDLVDALDYAKDDERIEVVYLELSRLYGTGLSKLQRVADAIEAVKAAGKPVIASADFMSQPGYYLAAHADEVFLHPDGAIMLTGYGRFRTYFADAIDKLRIDWNIFRVGTHKSAIEPFIRMNMSDEDRESTTRLIDQLWGLYEADVSAARQLESGAIDDFADNLVANLRAADGDLATAAKNHGLVDELLTRNEVRNRMIERVGAAEDDPDMFRAIKMRDYLAQMRLLEGGSVGIKNVAVIVAAGTIFFGEQAPGSIGADSTSALLRRARTDESVAAVVLRVDSPGGSAFAVEVIAEEIDALRQAGKPIVASMSSVAASGGYSIALRADRIFATPATITGSIGVFGMFPTYQRTIGALGVATDGVGSTPWSGQFRPDREMSVEAKQLFQLLIEDTYDDFISDVAAHRGLEKSEVDRIGQGKVWTGSDALASGLVDELGTLEDAIAAAASMADLDQDDYGIKLIETGLSAAEQFVVDLLGVLIQSGVDLSSWAGKPTAFEQLAREIGAKTDSILRFNDPKGIYLHCLCDVIQ